MPDSTIAPGQEDNGDCTTTFDEACVAALIEAANQEASESAGEARHASEVCEQIVNNDVPEACQQYVGDDWKGRDGGSDSKPVQSISITWLV